MHLLLMTRYLLVILFTGLISLASPEWLPGQPLVHPKVEDMLYPAFSSQLGGYIGEKLDSSYKNRILAQDVNRLIEPFLNRTESSCWQTEFWGKWFTSAILAYRYRPEGRLKMILDKAVLDLLKTQTPDGYIGNYADASHLEQWDIWGRKYCLLGLLAYYDLTNDSRILQAAKGLADHLIREINRSPKKIVEMGNHRGMAASSVLEPIVLLYVRTRESSYLDFAEKIVKEWETPDGPQLLGKSLVDVSKRFPKPLHNWFGWEQGQKAYEMMSCYEGLLELYRVTGNPEYLRAVENTWENIRRTELNIVGSGSAMECWFGGQPLQALAIRHYQETCVTVTWLKLSQQLLRLTGEAKYADAIEQTFYNALLGSMKADGSDWSKYTPLFGQRMIGEPQCNMGINCCEANGPRGLFTLPLTSIMYGNDGFSINFFIEGKFRIQTPGRQILELTQKTDYPYSGDIRIEIPKLKPEDMIVRIRVPSWSERTTIFINGQPFPVEKTGEYLPIHRVWTSGDLIRIGLDMRGRLLKLGKDPEYLALARGPMVLARDARLKGPEMDDPIRLLEGPDHFVELEPVAHPEKNIWMEFMVNVRALPFGESDEKPAAVQVCDYSSAGNTYDSGSRFRVWFPQIVDPVQSKGLGR
jgi:uncharacterized protein